MAEIKNIELLERLKDGDMLAFDAIYKQYFTRLYGFILKIIKQESDAEEILQQVFVKIWESRLAINTNSSFDSYLFTIAYNSTVSLLRKRVNEKKYLEHLKSIQQIESHSNIIEEIDFKDIKNNFQKLVGQLTPRQREIYNLSREEELTYSEIAKKLNISVNTVENHMVKALSFIKKNIDKSLLYNMLFISLFL
ncbi:RNA polymerase sigma-70 factor [Draconibacterium sp.]|nr:RNA polymerase sigma-70 factor [Draconibacterium sp.]